MFAIVKSIFIDVTDIIFKVGQAATSLHKHAVLPELWLHTHTQSRGIDEGSGQNLGLLYIAPLDSCI